MIAQITVLLLALLVAYSAERTGAQDRQWVALNSSGKLEYKATAMGDRIMDFSHAGYMGGGVALPTFPVKKEIAPSGGDDAAAIAEVSTLPMVNGIRGAVLLKPGIFHCAKPITLAQDGVVLRGSGSGKGGTSVELTGEPQGSIFIIEGAKLSLPKATPGVTYPVTAGPSAGASRGIAELNQFFLEKPTGALNLAIGCKGEPHPKSSKAAFFSAKKPVTPGSLYLAQLRERLGDAAAKNIGY